MEARLRAVPAAEPEEDRVAEPLGFEAFFGENRTKLFGALCLVTGNRHEAEEIAQDAFLKLWERWDRVSTLEDPTGFLFRTAMNVFRNRLRRAGLGMRKALALAPSTNATFATLVAEGEADPRAEATITLEAASGEYGMACIGIEPDTETPSSISAAGPFVAG